MCRYLFWTECGSSLALKRSSLVGDGIIVLKDEMSCGSTVTVDLKSSVYWLDWMGTVHTCDYQGNSYKELFADLADAIAIHNGRLFLFPVEKHDSFMPYGETFLNSDFDTKVIH